MKNMTLSNAIPVVAGMAALLWAAPVFAQTYTMRFTTPFQFMAGDRMFPAGQYQVTMDQCSHLLLQPVKETRTYGLGLSMNLVERSQQDLSLAVLRFTQYGDTLYLTAAWAPGHYEGRTLAPTPRLLEAARTAAETGSAGAAPADVYVK
jgi:hypothetical protein